MKTNRWLRFLSVSFLLAFAFLYPGLRPALAAEESAGLAMHCGLNAPANPRLELGTVLPNAFSGARTAPIDCFLVPTRGLNSPATVASLERWLDGSAEHILTGFPQAGESVPAVPGWLDGEAERILLAPR